MKLTKKYPQKKVSIIILNYNGWKDTIECLESVYKINYMNYNVIVVDNDSDDDSIIKIEEYCKKRFKLKSLKTPHLETNIDHESFKIRLFNSQINHESLILIENNKNFGFAEGNNIAIRYVLQYLDSEYILLLNNDTTVDENFLVKMICVGEKNKNCGILGPAIYNYDSKKTVSSLGANVNWRKGEVSFLDEKSMPDEEYLDVDYVEGCALLIKRNLLIEKGFLDSKYFCYWEDTDLCIRAKRSNYMVFCVKTAKIWHKGSKTTKKVSGFYEYYMTRNMFWLMKKYSNNIDFALFILYFFSYKMWIRIMTMIYNKNLKVFTPFLKGIIDGIRS